MTFTPTKTGQPTAAPLTVRPATPAPAPQRLQPPAEPTPQERARTSLTAHTTRPAHVQRQVASPVLSAATLQRQEEARLDGARAPLHRQAAELGAALPPGAVTTALQRHAAQHLPIAPPARPQGAADWVTVMRAHAQGIEGRNATTGLNSREVAQLSTLQRQVTQVITRDYRADRTPPAQRHATYAAHLLTLQRHPLSAPAARAALNLIPSGERPALQRALEDAARTDALQRQQDEQALALHAIQRQLAELDEQATQPVLHRIQARRGSGNPLPATVQRHLERGLNHDLSRVRIHDDAEADRLARGVNALAFTTGTDIYFRSGQFNPNTHTGLELLAHEVTHTVQQSQGRVGAGIDPDAGLEAQARHMGTTLAQMPALPTLVPAAHVGGPHAPGVYTHKAALKRAQAGAVQRAALKPLYDLQPGGLQRADDLTVQRWGLGDVWNATGGKVIEKGKEMIASGLQAIPGYHELCLAFGKDLVTGKTVGGSAEGILTALTNWVPGPLKDILRALKETNVIGKAWEWFKTQLGNLNLGGALSEIASAISHADLGKAKAAVTTRITGIKNLITGSATKIAEIALTAITAGLGPVGKQIMAGLRSAGTSIIKILKDPVAFAKNLINAVKGGFAQFASHAPTNLPKVLGGWLGTNTGITFPTTFNLPGILMTALSVVGLTYQAMRGRLVKALGPGGNEKVSKAETTVAALQTMKGGLQKADEMKAEGGGISSEISAGIKTEVTQSVILAGIRKLVTMLIPGGGFINAIIGAFQTVQTIVQQAANIGSVIVNGLSSVAAIAAGNISSAVGSIERALVSGLSVALTWLTKVLGLGNLGSKIKGIIGKVKGKLDKIIDKIVAKVKQMIEKLMGKGKGKDGKDRPINVDGTYGKVNFTAGKESHSIWTTVKGSAPEIYIASTPDKAIPQLSRFKQEAVNLNVYNELKPHFSDAGKAVSTGIAIIRKSINSSDRDVRLMINSQSTEASNQIARYVGVIRKSIQEARLNPPRMQTITVQFSTEGYPRDAQEYRLQLLEQQNGINRKTIAIWRSARAAFLASGRGSESAQRRARRTRNNLLVATFTAKLRKDDPNMSLARAEAEAGRLAKQWLDTQRALHAPDQVAGSMAHEIVALGKKEINGSIGGAWPHKIGIIDSGVANYISANPQADLTSVKMNVRLTI